MGKGADTPLTATAAREICERTGSAAVLRGSIAPIGNQYVLGLRATSCHTGKVLDQEQAQSERKEDVLNVLSGMASRLRTRLGESIAAVEKHDTPLAEATTSSLEALKAYSVAWKLHASGGATASLPLFKRATELDPNFAMAHASLGRVYADLDQSDLAAESITRAWHLRNPVSEREKFFITVNYEMLVTGNLEKARQTSEAWAQTYPREARPHHMLSGMINKAAGRYEEAAAEARKGTELDPDFAIGYYNLAVNNAYLGRFEEADKAMARGTARGLAIDEFLMLQHDLGFLRGNQAEMARVAAQARERPGAENWISNKEAFVLGYSGHLRQASDMSRRAAAEAQQAGQRERASLWEAGAAVREAFFGNSPEAKRRVKETLALSRNREVEYGAAFALALVGDHSGSDTLGNDLERRFPDDTLVRFNYLPSLRARLALSRGDFSQALEILQTAAPFELGINRNVLFGALYPVYVRGEAYLAAKKGQEAAAEFQKILDHRGIVVSDPIGALAHLQLARAYVLSGDNVKARTSYADFLRLWKDADPDIPVLKEAKAEYANLQ
jgi:tetratricopeptide (TPR) repeat protein